MKIEVLGAGNIGRTLGRHWVRAGHEVMFSRHREDSPSLDQALRDAPAGEQVGSVADTVTFGEVLVLALPFGPVQRVLTDVRLPHQ